MYSLERIINIFEQNNQLIRITKEVDPEYEASALIKKIQKSTNTAILFENLKGYSFPLASNFFGSLENVCSILGCEQTKINEFWNSKEKLASESEMEFEVDEVNYSEKYIDCSLSDLPLLKYHEKDAGKYITAGVVLAKDPDTGVHNLSFHRMEYVDDTKLKIRITPGNHLEDIYKKAELAGKPLEIAILIGGHPALMLAGSSRVPFHVDELKLAEAFIGDSINLRKCKTVDIYVPSNVDFVVEGAIIPKEREEEGPFGDFFNYYVPVMENHVLKVKNVARLKNNSCAYGILAGSVEQDKLAGIPLSANIYRHLSDIFTSVVDVNVLPPLYHSIVKIEQQYEGQARQVGHAALSCDPSQTKYCTVVDSDVNIYDPLDIQWATITRCSPDKDIYKISNVPSFRRDPHKMFWGKMIFDATKPLDEAAALEFERTKIPGYEDIKLEDYY